MDAVEYLKTRRRLCKSKADCSECPLFENFKEDGYFCIAGISECAIGYEEKAVQIVEQWAKDNPVKTRQSEFLKMFPAAKIDGDVVDIMPCNIEKEMRKCCGDRACDECKRTYWLTEVTP